MEKLFYVLNNDELELMQQVEETTGVDYELKCNDMPLSSLICAIKDLMYEYDKLQEEFENYKERQDNDYNPEIEIPNIHYENMMSAYRENR